MVNRTINFMVHKSYLWLKMASEQNSGHEKVYTFLNDAHCRFFFPHILKGLFIIKEEHNMFY